MVARRLPAVHEDREGSGARAVEVRHTQDDGLRGFQFDARAVQNMLRDNGVAAVTTTHEGMGAFSFEPTPGEKYHLKIDKPAGVENEPKLPEVAKEQEIVLNTGLGVFEAGSPLEFNVQSSKQGLPLVAAAWCRGVPVGQTAFTTSEQGSNPVAISLSDEAAGVIRLTIYDYSQNRPKPLAERLVYRRPQHRLQVEMRELRPDNIPCSYWSIATGLGASCTAARSSAFPCSNVRTSEK